MLTSKETTNRADEIRRRRVSRPVKGRSTSAPKRRQKTSAPAPPPVLVRGGFASPYGGELRREKRAKRRYDVALNTTGAEIRLPALPAIRLGWRLASGVLGLGLAVMIYLVWNYPMFQVSTAEVEGVRRLKAQDINAVAGVEEMPVILVDPDRIREDLEAAFPELSSVTVSVSLPAKVLVSVEERRPVLAWKQGEKTVWVDSNGIAFPARGEPGPAILVEAQDFFPMSTKEAALAEDADQDKPEATSPEMIEDPGPAMFLPPELVHAIQVMSDQSPQDSPLVYDKEHGLGWRDKRGWDVFFGTSVEEMEMKLQVYKAVVKRIKKEGLQPSFISVEHIHAPYFRLER